MIAEALFFTAMTGLCFASVSMIVSGIARERISFFQYFTMSNFVAATIAWITFVNWRTACAIDWRGLLLITGAVGLVNTASQAALVCTLKWGHNGLSVAIRNSASVISMFYALIFLHEKISVINFAGVILVIVSLGVIAVFGKKSSFSSDLKKWIPAVVCSLLISAAYQILLTNTVMLPENVRQAGVIVPCLISFCSIGNLIASLLERRILKRNEPFFRFSRKVWKVMSCWVAVALFQYYVLVRALTAMRQAGMSSLVWPMLIGINVTVFSVFCRLKWKEKYPLTTLLGMAGCVLGLIMIIWGRK